GGLAAIEHLNRRKSSQLYAAIDADPCYHCSVNPADRSWVNVCFHLPNASLEAEFLDQAQTCGLVNLKGHGARGGIRASLYNAMPEAGVDALIDFMALFSARHHPC
ncbi:MAG: aminotransferase class V-fold PLP-dependent enzyme, partial [Gammaproteobacteria bacterium]|nr:aminotransferase class V-fold PLP-dependent enzyme [Gammaproteobacteria bacterium]